MSAGSTRKRTRSRSSSQRQHDNDKSLLRLQLEQAIESPGGTKKVLHLIQTATNHDITDLNTNQQWTPLVGAIFRFGKNTTKNGNSLQSSNELVRLIRACHDKGLDVIHSGARFGGGHYHRPLVVAAYYGYHAAVRLLIEYGALPDLGDGEGRNVWFSAFQNPMASGGNHRLRECDKCTAQVLIELGAVTNDLGVWRRAGDQSPKGSLCYANGDSSSGSVLLRALINRNLDVVKFLLQNQNNQANEAAEDDDDDDSGGAQCTTTAVLTDRDYLWLKHMGKIHTRLLPMVVDITLLGNSHEGTKPDIDSTTKKTKAALMQQAKSWSPEIDWSFPPTWKSSLVLCQSFGLPSDIFQTHVVPFLGRDWFYTPSQLDSSNKLPLLGPCLGDKEGTSKGLEWV